MQLKGIKRWWVSLWKPCTDFYFTPSGEANVYFVHEWNGHWFMKIQCNGEMPCEEQKTHMKSVVRGLNSNVVERQDLNHY